MDGISTETNVGADVAVEMSNNGRLFPPILDNMDPTDDGGVGWVGLKERPKCVM